MRGDRDARGFSLIELLIALTIVGVALGSTLWFFLGQVRSSRLVDTGVEAIQRARFASELLRREISLAGSGMPDAQPIVVYAGPDDFIFSSDLASSVLGDRVALHVLPAARSVETEGADSASITLPNGEAYPRAWYGGVPGLSGPAETIHFAFVDVGDGSYALTRSLNGVPPDTLLRDLRRIGGEDFFSYEFYAEAGSRGAGSGPYWHSAAYHDSPEDTADSARSDSIKVIHARFNVRLRDHRPNETAERSFSLAVALRNAGLIGTPACGEVPRLGSAPAVDASVDPLRVEIRWAPAIDERGGEEDILGYTLYRRKSREMRPLPIATVPPDRSLASYLYLDTDVELGQTYIYLLGATDCTPKQSTLVESEPVLVN